MARLVGPTSLDRVRSRLTLTTPLSLPPPSPMLNMCPEFCKNVFCVFGCPTKFFYTFVFLLTQIPPTDIWTRYQCRVILGPGESTQSVTTIITTTTIYHFYHHNNHHLSLSSSQQPPSVTIIITTTSPFVTIIIKTTTICHYNHHNHHNLSSSSQPPPYHNHLANPVDIGVERF